MSTPVSRRKMLKRGAAAAAGGTAFAQQSGVQAQQPGPRSTNTAGRKFRAIVGYPNMLCYHMLRYHNRVSVVFG